jgi:signal peptidase II
VADPRRTGIARWAEIVLVAAAVVVVDQWIKTLVARHLPVAASVPVIPGVVSLTHVHNRGIAFGLFSGVPPYVTMGVALTLLAALFYNRGRWHAERVVGAGIALIAGGAIGNMLDRLRLGYVVDYVDLHVWPVFNVADAAIVVGAAILVVVLSRGGRPSGARR